MKSVCLAIAGMLLTSVAAYAEECTINYTRAACPGQEAESYAKCDGQVSCSKAEAATTAEECQAMAVKACSNNRINITKSKVITATWQGQPLKSASGNDDFCLDYSERAAEYDQCDAQ